MDDVLREEEDDGVISHLNLTTRVQNGIEHCSSNNNNDIGIMKAYKNEESRDEESEVEAVTIKKGILENDESECFVALPEKDDEQCFKNSQNTNCGNKRIELGSDDENTQRLDDEIFAGEKTQDTDNFLQTNTFCSTVAENDLVDKNGEAYTEQKNFRKNNTFPLYGNGHYWLQSVASLQNSESGIPHPGKRVLPPIEKVAYKKHRTLSDSKMVLVNPTTQGTPLSTIEGSPAKTANEKSEVRFEIGEDDASDQETYDTSTSSDLDGASASSSLEEESEMNESNISENLQNKLLHVLKFEEFRSNSPTASVSSAPVFPNRNRLSVNDEDSRSIVSDSKLISSSSHLEQKRFKRRLSPSEDLIIRQTPLSDADYMAEAQEDSDLTPRSALGDKLLNYEQDDLSESPSIRSTGILPAIPLHGARERSFLVGNLTKHGSLLGADELNRYFPDRMLRLFVGTWNMQRKGVPRNLNDFLLPKHGDYLQDMYVIGVQEATQDLKKWEIKLQETLGVNHVLAHSVSHGVLHMSVFIRRDLIWFCSPFEEDRVTTRMVSQIKTKGAVAIAFQFFGTSMIFITSHFHSGETRVKERMEDYTRIKEKIKLPKKLQWDTYKSSSDDVSTRFDCTFWFGDLNFRVNMPHQIIHDEVNNPEGYDLKEVLKGDQLSAEMKRGSIFRGFTEPKIKFLPTYKFTPGTDNYDTSPKMRVPSYTDRILYKCKENSMITCNKYDSATTLKKSDHKPVYGFFEVCLRPGRDSIPFGGGKFRNDVYEKAARLRAQQGNYQNNSAVCNIL